MSSPTPLSSAGNLRRAAFMTLAVIGFPGALPQARADPSEGPEIAHPFFTHEGLPDAVGSASVRGSGLGTRIDGQTEGDFAYHVETGLTDTIGLHLRSDQFLNSRRSEVMFQFVAWKSKDGESGFAPIIEFEVPTRSGGGKPATLVGFTTKYANPRFAFNQSFHYGPAEKTVEGSAAIVWRASDRIYPVFEVFGEGGTDKSTIVEALAGVKYRVRGSTLVGLAYRRPVTSERENSSQLVLQVDFMAGASDH